MSLTWALRGPKWVYLGPSWVYLALPGSLTLPQLGTLCASPPSAVPLGPYRPPVQAPCPLCTPASFTWALPWPHFPSCCQLLAVPEPSEEAVGGGRGRFHRSESPGNQPFIQLQGGPEGTMAEVPTGKHSHSVPWKLGARGKPEGDRLLWEESAG